MTDGEAEAFINGIELLRDGDGKALGCKHFKPFGGWLAEVKDDTTKKGNNLVLRESFAWRL